jgi:hypothetical protein
MTTCQARKILKRIRQGARYPERTRDRAAEVWSRWRDRRVRLQWDATFMYLWRMESEPADTADEPGAHPTAR